VIGDSQQAFEAEHTVRRSVVEVDGIRLSYWELGEGAPIVCLHATGHSAQDFRATALRWQASGRAGRWIALDWPGQGDSGVDESPASAERYSELLRGFLVALSLKKPLLFGNSIGGAAAIAACSRGSVEVSGLVLANPGGLAEVDDFSKRFCSVMAKFFRAGERGARWFPLAYAIYYRMILRGAAVAEDRRRVVADGPRCARALAEAWESFGTPGADLRDDAATVTAPVLFTWARSDQILAFERSRAGVEKFRNHELQFFKGGHCAFLEDPEAFDTTLASFVGEQGTAA
jgi:pimeloyl-ACP methyl ester carboxylesterase